MANYADASQYGIESGGKVCPGCGTVVADTDLHTQNHADRGDPLPEDE